jgi:predicted lipid-binding transport protein (Tim44 family)/RNA polymerase subunit RPABC4/transcription elongation factor Spt4
MDRLKKHRTKLLWLLPVMLIIGMLLLAPDLWGRPGGGSSYSGGSSHSSGGSSYSGGGGGGGDGAGLIILLIKYPQIGIPVVVIIILIRVFGTKRAAPSETITTRHGRDTMIWNRQKVDAALNDFSTDRDPEFSQTLFLDFAQHLYYQYHYHRTHPEILNLRPYFASDIITNAAPKAGFKIDVTELVIGSLDFAAVLVNEDSDYLSVRFEANYTETIAGHSNRWGVQETWTFARKAGLRSPAPAAMQAMGCPNCGAALLLSPTGACQQCKMVVEPGAQTWTVYTIQIARRDVQKGGEVGTYAPEEGTNLPTLFDPKLTMLGQRFVENNQLSSITEYAQVFREKVVEPIFHTIYKSWTAREYAAVRPIMSDNLFQSHYYWIETYKKHQLINRLDSLTITSVNLVKLDIDKYYEAATVRIFASVLDYTTFEDGKLKGGDPRNPRRFSEYWTFVRRAGIHKEEKLFNPDACPNCGAPVNMGMTGVCSYCHSKVTTGEFGWVLSRITQDEAYYG